MILAGPYIYNSGHNKRYAAGIKTDMLLGKKDMILREKICSQEGMGGAR